jgi:hypothetical protein
MKSPLVLSGLSLLLTTVACAKADAPTTTPIDDAQPAAVAGDSSATDGHGEHAHEHDFAGSVDAFHDTMAPLWHAEPGPARATDTCAAAADLATKAESIVAEDAPEAASDAEAWKTASAGLVASVQQLQAVCADSTEAAEASFDDTFKSVHEAFHVLVALVGHEEG